ncbi:hypothetical protein F66182_6336 [Fusarium sp. NRRL 66182]|nr:hypothetical protein F66182_6336 [Fusarium sp. NRRL 66182]
MNTQGVHDDPDCWPPRKAPVETGYAFNGWGFYSPGLECPDGYEPACSATGPLTGDFNFQYSIHDAETVTGCCPSGYMCAQPGGPQTCTSVASRGSLQVASCSSRKTILNWLTLPATLTEELAGQETTINGITIYAPMFQINKQETDLSLSTALSTESTQSNSITTVTEIADFRSPGGAARGGLSTGAQAIIGAVAGCIGLAIVGVVFCLWRNRRRNKRSAATTADLDSQGPRPAGDLAGTQGYYAPQSHVSHQSQPVQLQTCMRYK